MRLSSALFAPLILLLSLTGCGGASEPTNTDTSPVPAAVECADSPQLREQALEHRRQSRELSSDRGKIIATNRAKFFASLAAIAELQCAGATAQAGDEVKQALAVARSAQATRSEYEAALRWAEADLIAAGAIENLIREKLAASPPQ